MTMRRNPDDPTGKPPKMPTCPECNKAVDWLDAKDGPPDDKCRECSEYKQCEACEKWKEGGKREFCEACGDTGDDHEEKGWCYECCTDHYTCDGCHNRVESTHDDGCCDDCTDMQWCSECENEKSKDRFWSKDGKCDRCTPMRKCEGCDDEMDPENDRIWPDDRCDSCTDYFMCEECEEEKESADKSEQFEGEDGGPICHECAGEARCRRHRLWYEEKAGCPQCDRPPWKFKPHEWSEAHREAEKREKRKRGES